MAAKIADGLFIGDAESSQDPEFLELNKISNLINFSGKQVPNIWSSHGLVYLTFDWDDSSDFIFFDGRDDNLVAFIDFIDVSLRHGVSVLLISTRGVGRAAVGVCIYLMYKYRWGFEKTYDFIFAKKPDIDINRGFMQQLFALDKHIRIKTHHLLKMQGIDVSSFAQVESMRWKDWDPSYIRLDSRANIRKNDMDSTYPRGKKGIADSPPGDTIDESPEDELILINSYLNSKQTISALPGPFQEAIEIPKAFRLRFNGELQEEDINLFPTSPPKGAAAVSRRGIIKGIYSYPSLRDSQLSNSRVGTDAVEFKAMGPRPTAGRPARMQAETKGLSSVSSELRASRYSDKESPGRGKSQHAISADTYGGNSRESYTAEDRLRDLVAEMRLPKTAHPVYVSEEKGAAPSPGTAMRSRCYQGQDSVASIISEASSLRVPGGILRSTPTLHEIANMQIPNHQQQQSEQARAAAPQSVGFNDPLSAFETIQQQGGAVRARYDVTFEDTNKDSGPWKSGYSKTRSSSAGGSSREMHGRGQPANAWAASSSSQRSASPQQGGGVRNGTPLRAPASASVSTSQRHQAAQGPRTYRYGSPAPSRVVNSGAGSGSTRPIGGVTQSWQQWVGKNVNRATSAQLYRAPTASHGGGSGSSIMSVSSLGSNTSSASDGRLRPPGGVQKRDMSPQVLRSAPGPGTIPGPASAYAHASATAWGGRPVSRPASPFARKTEAASGVTDAAGPNASPVRASLNSRNASGGGSRSQSPAPGAAPGYGMNTHTGSGTSSSRSGTPSRPFRF